MTIDPVYAYESIPLYINGFMQGKARIEFEKLLASDRRLRQEYEEFCEIEQVFINMENKYTVDLDAVLGRIHECIKKENRKSSFNLGEWFRDLIDMPRLAWGIAMAQFAVIAVLVAGNMQQQPVLTTLSNDKSLSEIANKPEFVVIFAETATVTQVSQLLTNIDATIVDGPSRLGVVNIALMERDADADKVLMELERSSIVVLAKKAL